MNPVEALGIPQVFLRLGAATALGGAIGLNRELHGKPAGLRTHALVTLGATLATMVALPLQGAGDDVYASTIGRVIQGVLTGVGFLGAGVILRDTSGHVTGLTTAATIWVCAGLGIVCGLGYWTVLAVTVAFVSTVLVFGRGIELAAERVFRRRGDQPPDHGV